MREIARQGGIASGESRRERKKLKEELTAILSTGDVQERLCTALIDRALTGDTGAFKAIRDTVGEGVTNKVRLEDQELESFGLQNKDALFALAVDEVKKELEK